MKVGTSLLILIAGITSLLEGCGRADGSGRQHEAKPFEAIYIIRNNPYFDVLNQGIEEVVEANGDTLLTGDPPQNQEKQNKRIQEMIDKGIQMLFLSPVDWEKVQPALGACREVGVGIINVDAVMKDRDSVVSVIETDNYQVGQLYALDMMRRKDEAKIVIPNNPIQTSITSREQGFLDTVADNDSYRVVYEEATAGEIEVFSHVMADLPHYDISPDMILRGGDPTALGALAAPQQAKREEEVLIYGIDGSPDFRAILDVGYVTGTSAQGPGFIGRKTAETVYRCLNREPVGKYIGLPGIMVTRDNLREFKIDGRQ